MLALPEAETEEFIEAKAAEGTPVKDMTVKKLREEIKQWKAKAEDADKQISQLQADASKSCDTQNKLQTELDTLHFDFDDAKSVAAAARKERDAALAAAREAEEKLKNQQLQQLQQQLTDRPIEVTVPADYHDNKKALADAQEEIAQLTLQIYSQNNERVNAEEYALLAQKLDTISALITDYRKNNPQRLEQIIALFKDFIRIYQD